MKAVTVLMIDDDDGDYIIVKSLLAKCSRAEYTCIRAETYAAGKKALLTLEYDVALIDYRLPDGNGIDLIRESIREGNAHPMFIFTGFEDRTLQIKAIRAGAVDYLEKAIVTSDMLDRSFMYAMALKEQEKTTDNLSHDSMPMLMNRLLDLNVQSTQAQITMASEISALRARAEVLHDEAVTTIQDIGSPAWKKALDWVTHNTKALIVIAVVLAGLTLVAVYAINTVNIHNVKAISEIKKAEDPHDHAHDKH